MDLFSAESADFLARSLLGESHDFEGKVLVVYMSVAGYWDAADMASRYPNGIAVIAGPKLYSYLKENGEFNMVYVGKNTRENVLQAAKCPDFFKSGATVEGAYVP